LIMQVLTEFYIGTPCPHRFPFEFLHIEEKADIAVLLPAPLTRAPSHRNHLW
jgi:hypothetical protein